MYTVFLPSEMKNLHSALAFCLCCQSAFIQLHLRPEADGEELVEELRKAAHSLKPEWRATTPPVKL